MPSSGWLTIRCSSRLSLPTSVARCCADSPTPCSSGSLMTRCSSWPAFIQAAIQGSGSTVPNVANRLPNLVASCTVNAPGEEQLPNVPPSASRERLVAELAKVESELEQIESKRTAAQARIAALRNEVATLDAIRHHRASEALSGLAPRTSAGKVTLFRQLFRGRPDVYPTRFVSKKTGKAGYAPACSNKFVPGVCELPKVKCGDCTRQAFKPVDDADQPKRAATRRVGLARPGRPP